MTSQPEHAAATAPLAERPRMARLLIANWRLNTFCQGDDLFVGVVPGEWPAGAPDEIAGVPIRQDPEGLFAEHAGFMYAMGKVPSGEWRVAVFPAFELMADMTRDDMAIVTTFLRVDDDGTVVVEVGDSNVVAERGLR
jgi:hypothetical protein